MISCASKSAFESRLLVATVSTVGISKFFTSAVISIYSGISAPEASSFPEISGAFFLRLSLIFENPILSLSPGIAMPTNICLLPSERTLPLVISIFENISASRIEPVVITNGTLTSCCFPSTVTVCFALLVKSYLIFIFPLLPASSSGLISCPSSL